VVAWLVSSSWSVLLSVSEVVLVKAPVRALPLSAVVLASTPTVALLSVAVWSVVWSPTVLVSVSVV
jgi:hypothetical protein